MKRFMTRPLIMFLCASGMLAPIHIAFASGFQLSEQDVTALSNFHAGYAALANNASINFYNPAGLTRFDHQEMVFTGFLAVPDIQYKGTVAVNNINNFTPYQVTAQGGNVAVIPAFHYAAPITDKVVFGFSIVAPFGMQTNYGFDTYLRYATTLTSAQVVDISPSLGIRITDTTSVGFGPDLQKMTAEFNQVAVVSDPAVGDSTDTTSTNRADDTGWGFHAGAMYEYSEDTRVGLSYHSQVVHHLSRKSSFVGPLADLFNNGPIISRATANVTLPPYTALSAYHRINSQFAVMGSAVYTQWSTIKNLVLNNVAAIDLINFVPNPNLTVIIPENFHNSWSFSVGSDYDVTDNMVLRGGLGYDQTPVTNAYRNVQMPDNNRYVVALGGHYQFNKAFGLDLAWSHFFIPQAHISPPTQVTGDQQVITSGSVKSSADAYGVQLVWDIV